MKGLRSGLDIDKAYQKAGFCSFEMPKENDSRPFITMDEVKRTYWRNYGL